uniref:Uncharacterized protein n=1 Tax=Rhizophagus irregularis (strain DAOM 181602 / DAOM 197198 / MUCL 43194) TaxID=747089 RepID=U9UCS3_RHIID
MVVCQIIEKDKHKESCFIEVKHFSITRSSNIWGYNLYKVAILYQRIFVRLNLPKISLSLIL